MSEAPTSSRSLLTSVARAADVLLLFTRDERDDLGVTEVGDALGLSKAVVHRTLTTLAAKGLVEADPRTRRYRLGPAALTLGVHYGDRLDVRRLAAPALRSLSARTGETATLAIRSGDERVYVDQVPPDREVQMTVVLGRPAPLHAGAAAKAILAFLPDAERDRYLDQALEPVTERTLTTPRALRDELATIHRRGYATSIEERRSGAASVAAPLLDHRDQPAAVVCLCGPADRLRDQVGELATALLDTTARLSEQLGHRPTSEAVTHPA